MFEFDEVKSKNNLEKHEIDFVEAQLLWLDTQLVEIPAHSVTEPRFMVVGRIGRKHWSAVITYRNGIIRLISVRRSREEEIEIYES